MRPDGALAIFVKTPGLSPVKTRLAAAIGQKEADRFYHLTIAAIRAVAINLQEAVPGLQVYWAVAEVEGLQALVWKDFPRIYQGERSLGDRLALVYDTLLPAHDYVTFIGADSPHLTVATLKDALSQTAQRKSFVLGETLDGGFYFFGGSKSIPREIWQSIEYSSAHTAIQLGIALRSIGKVDYVEKSFDIDFAEDLAAYRKLSFPSSNLLPEQLEVVTWARRLR